MANYKIVGLENHIITLEYDGTRRGFPLPMVDGKYPENAELAVLLDSYVAHQRSVTANQNSIVASNKDAILALVEPPALIELVKKITIQRNILLQATDWTQATDSRLTTNIKMAWSIYRQSLRDITLQSSLTANGTVVWPIPPTPVFNARGIQMTSSIGEPLLPA